MPRKQARRDIEHYDGSDNVYRDLGFDHREEWATKARIATKVFKLIAKRSLTQSQTDAILGVAQGRVSDLKRGLVSSTNSQ